MRGSLSLIAGFWLFRRKKRKRKFENLLKRRFSSNSLYISCMSDNLFWYDIITLIEINILAINFNVSKILVDPGTKGSKGADNWQAGDTSLRSYCRRNGSCQTFHQNTGRQMKNYFTTFLYLKRKAYVGGRGEMKFLSLKLVKTFLGSIKSFTV